VQQKPILLVKGTCMCSAKWPFFGTVKGKCECARPVLSVLQSEVFLTWSSSLPSSLPSSSSSSLPSSLP
jgi:hypothetical protein